MAWNREEGGTDKTSSLMGQPIDILLNVIQSTPGIWLSGGDVLLGGANFYDQPIDLGRALGRLFDLFGAFKIRHGFVQNFGGASKITI
jgi:hypothetical protein